MTFEFVRWNGPNAAAILALAVVPMIAFATLPPPATGLARQSEPAAICQTAAECPLVAAASDGALE
jgi:hypothetical protein